MAKKKLVFSFPPMQIEEPVTYQLITGFELKVNILRAKVSPRERGRMVVEVEGSKENMERAMSYLEEQGMQVDTLVQEMRHLNENCVHCTACTAICPTGALSVEDPSREVSFEASKCIICEACIPTCSYRALESQF